MEFIELIKRLPLIHCARGPKWCENCRALMKKGDHLCHIKVFLESGMIARPMTEIIKDGNKVLCEYDVIKVFYDEIEAENYALINNIEIQN